MAGCWIQYYNGDWGFKIDKDRMGRAIDVEFIISVDKLKERIVEEYSLLGAPVIVKLSYWLHDDVSDVTGERKYPLQISNSEDYKIFTSFRKVDKWANVFVTFRDKVDGKVVDKVNAVRVGITSSVVVGDMDVVTGNEMKGGEEDVLDDETISMHVEEIEKLFILKNL